jgi:glutaconate CoA-transferase subunit B
VHEADDESGELVLAALYAGVTAGEARAGVGWPLRERPQIDRVAPPSAEDLRLMREVLDPKKLYLK